ncbi:MAG TPA: undecaprenyldiphospho-muramoylpentapeptide beta-N-acetylglucosaminyltransferase, partial [Acidimicrobiales bacterium]|nr:undecaprenyldiphospho-muramoylpentapeptide beta-N-acetylglucosaminyltransferase [Acidimicrobiales bacterium]
APVWAVVAGGGTAGHVLPALAAARALVARGHPPESVRFVGSARGQEARLVPEAGFPVTLLPGRGIARRLTADNVGAAAGLARGLARAVVLLRRWRPAVVLSVGGYASVPAVVAAAVWRVPLVLHEQNAVPGLANRLAGRVARASAVSFEGTPLPRAVLTGNPVRDEIAAVDRSPAGRRAARRRLGLPEEARVVAVVGGSLGARRINEAVFALVEAWAGRAGVAVRHAVGARDWAAVAPRLPRPAAGGLVYQPVEYEHRMPDLLGAADVVVGRAGGSVAELTAAGVASLLVPLPTAPNDHQTANATALARAGAAVVVPDAELGAERLAAELGALLDDPGRLAAMERAARSMARPDAAERVADVVERHARR